MKIDITRYNIKPNKDITLEINKLLSDVENIKGKKIINLEKGTYYLNTDKMDFEKYYISNTIAKDEWGSNDKKNYFKFALKMKNLSDLIINGNGSLFLIDGKASTFIIENSKNITIKNISFDSLNPDMHLLKVLSSDKLTAAFEIDKVENTYIKDNRLFYKGHDFDYFAGQNAHWCWWFGHVEDPTKPIAKRGGSPFHDSIKEEIIDNKLIITYNKEKELKVGSHIYVYSPIRKNVGMFINKSENITLDNVSHHLSYSLATIIQDTKDVTIKNCTYAPRRKDFLIASVADFIHISLCRGHFTVKDNYFQGAGDDILNVHGFHFKVIEKNENNIIVSFMHPQAFGFNPFHDGDTLMFIKGQTLQELETRKVISSEKLTDETIRITLDKECTLPLEDLFIENMSASASLDFINNTSKYIMTRGVLITTRGKVNILNNKFLGNYMAGVLVSNDAKTWYESSKILDVTVKGNIFDNQGAIPVHVTPEVEDEKLVVHESIKILNNKFLNYNSPAISLKNIRNVEIKGNKFENKENDILYIKPEK